MPLIYSYGPRAGEEIKVGDEIALQGAPATIIRIDPTEQVPGPARVQIQRTDENGTYGGEHSSAEFGAHWE